MHQTLAESLLRFSVRVLGGWVFCLVYIQDFQDKNRVHRTVVLKDVECMPSPRVVFHMSVVEVMPHGTWVSCEYQDPTITLDSPAAPGVISDLILYFSISRQRYKKSGYTFSLPSCRSKHCY